MGTNPLFDGLFGQHVQSEAAFLRLPGRTMSYRAFLEGAARFANLLWDAGLRPGDRFALQVPKSPEALQLYAASVMTGTVFLPLNTAYTAEEVRYFLEDSSASLFIAGAPADADLAAIAEQLGARFMTLGADGSGSLVEHAAGQPASFAPVARDEDDLAALVYTSGTTGRPKGAMISQRNLLSNATTLKQIWEFTAEDMLLHALPIFHVHGLFVATNVVLAAGGSMLFHDRFDVDRTLADLPRATAMMGVPTFYTRLLADPRFDRSLTGHMRLFISGSAPLLAETHRQFEKRTGHRILERYGMTETGMNTSNPYRGERRAGTVGLPLPDVALRVSETDEDGVGVIEVKGPNVFRGYWGMPEKTAEEMTEDGFFITGDLGRIGADGYVEIVGRQKDLIISGGLNVYPKEIERVLDSLPGVLESAVIGLPHADFGETPVAVLAKRPGETIDEDAVMAALAEQLARFKHPRALVVVEGLPRNAMGKVQKNVLRDTYRGVLAH